MFAGDVVFIDDTIVDAERARVAVCVRQGGGAVTSMPDSVTVHVKAPHSTEDVDDEDAVLGRSVVTVDWVLRSAACERRLDARLFSPRKSALFSGVIAYFPPWSQENKTVAHGSMTAIKEWGGSLTFDVDKVDRSHSHVIVELIESDKYDGVLAFAATFDLPVVSYEWVVESHRAKRRLPEADFPPKVRNVQTGAVSLPPRSQQQQQQQQQQQPPSLSVPSSSQDTSRSHSSQTTSATFLGLCFYLLDLPKDQVRELRRGIKEASGRVYGELTDEVTHIVCQQVREQDLSFDRVEFVKPLWVSKSIEAGRRLDLLEAQRFLPPILGEKTLPSLGDLLLVADGMQITKGDANVTVAMTNYRNRERNDLRRIVQQLFGASAPVDLNPSRAKVLVCESAFGDKYNEAIRCRLPVVNHLWLIDSLAKGRLLLDPDSLAAKRYSTAVCSIVPPLSSCLLYLHRRNGRLRRERLKGKRKADD